ncbi:dye-decolorizing heme-containing peroxidase [Paramarasmius palmivorus]|uniref:Dye-decolorizing heme-containing peroxidase n=1 Tax=Paramarasmius palmivorus TaxID=297713 RepID=A0AAW0C1Y0_9AGAR
MDTLPQTYIRWVVFASTSYPSSLSVPSALLVFALQMRLPFITFALGLSTVAIAASHVKQKRATSILIDPAPQPDLPSASEARIASTSEGLNLDDIQGDILIGMKKDKELFFFFSIQDAATFKSKLGTDIHDLITPTTQLLDEDIQPTTAVNIAFSQSGLTALGVSGDLIDPDFKQGQFSDATKLGDASTDSWIPGFAGKGVHGVFLIASNTLANVNDGLANIQSILGDSITEIHRLQGAARPGSEEGHEHFGYMDGISQPHVQGFGDGPKPGQTTIQAGIILTGEDGDGSQTLRPSWAKGGSFLAFRQLQQRVPEFDKFVSDNALSVPGLTAQENADLFGARMLLKGAPIDLAPLRDDKELGNDRNRNNDFTYEHPEVPDFDISTNQTLCPFAAHVRKTNPRATINVRDENHIIRAGIPYGPEVTDAEASAQASSDSPDLERGLAFVSYQSIIGNGFAFIQKSWANSERFPIFNTSLMFTNLAWDTLLIHSVGADPIIGALNGRPRTVTGLDPLNFTKPFVLNTDFVVSRGGEYFFSPPISALVTTLSK